MRSIEISSGGSPHQDTREASGKFSLSLPFGQSIPFSSINGPTYVTAQTLVQQVAYALSNNLFTYSPDSFDLDTAVQHWSSQAESNANGDQTSIHPMQTRQGAGNIALGYIFSKDFDLKKRHIPQSVIASSATLQYMRPALEQLSLLYSIASPLVAHIAAVDYIGGSTTGLVSDYATAASLAEELGLALVASNSPHESQHMALFSTLLATYFPTIHIYDGIRVGRETTRVVDVLGQKSLGQRFESVSQAASGQTEKHLDSEGKLLNLLNAFNDELGTDYGLFDYHGHPEASTVLVTFGSVESSLAAQVATSLAKDNHRVGVVNVRVYRPFVEEEFLKALPSTTKAIGVLGQVQNDLAVHENGVHSSLYDDVLAAITFNGALTNKPECIDVKYSVSQALSLADISAIFEKVSEGSLQSAVASTTIPVPNINNPDVEQFIVLDTDNSASGLASVALAPYLATDSTHNISVNTVYDNLTQGGIVRTDIRKSSKSINTPCFVDSADVIYVGDIKLLAEIDILSSAKDGAKIIINAPGVKDEDLEKKLPECFRYSFAKSDAALFILDTSAIQENHLASSIFQAAFLSVALPSLDPIKVKKFFSTTAGTDAFESLSSALQSSLRQIEAPETWKTSDDLVLDLQRGADIQSTSFVPFEKEESEPSLELKDWQDAAKGLAFKEAYGTQAALRPDLATKTYTVTVQENRRLTPTTYDRNIFHIEFDLGDSGLKYDIGEALGIHAENDADDVNDFIKFYDLNPDDIVEVPSREDNAVMERRTVYQALVHNVDIFGKPPKKFYESLSEFATDENEKNLLLKLGSAQGAEEFKRRSEVDMLSFADLFHEFPSAHPNAHDLMKIVNPMKRREYSIASCQKVTPTAVALMIVVVDWVDTKGRQRFGQASYYLTKLRPGATVTVSVKPSVMKLPPNSTQPIIMAGLGTGLAPFRAFVQHRALEKAQGKEIGSVLLYMGSRHQREEYCYGEEWEAYQAAGVITLLGRAFSRDQPHKIYIQDRMRETLPEITQAYLQENGAFYLCGPTWPVPDVTAVLEEAITVHAKASNPSKKVESRKEIEKLKEELRYVLEVY
ncbi:hypothetical protein FQN57_000496 [Myotisia sp. PD_48]|nr:hypothetical protein FQN57_000496 [Myotisia sp. PD_48]